MIRLLVISDTHYPSRKVPGKFYELVLNNHDAGSFDGIIHCGDIQEIDFYDELLELGLPVYAVLGNNYDFMLERQLPRRRVLTFENVNIGLVHGNGPLCKAIDNARKEFIGESIDLVCYGHSHIASIENIGGLLFFNPGSLTCSRNGLNTYGIIEIDGDNIRLNIEKFF
jgi:hypothetical protein